MNLEQHFNSTLHALRVPRPRYREALEEIDAIARETKRSIRSVLDHLLEHRQLTWPQALAKVRTF